jgi:hypothetical protein
MKGIIDVCMYLLQNKDICLLEDGSVVAAADRITSQLTLLQLQPRQQNNKKNYAFLNLKTKYLLRRYYSAATATLGIFPMAFFQCLSVRGSPEITRCFLTMV